LQAFDVFAIPSIWEGLPMAMLEAMAWGCPVVSTNVGGIGSVLRHRDNGSLIPPRDPAALANELAAVLGSAELRARYRAEGLKTFQENYSAEVMTRRYEQVYLDSLASRGRTRAAQSPVRSAPANEWAASRGRPS
jgi:glycosyltransferase involved in cell wall biosynthesis